MFDSGSLVKIDPEKLGGTPLFYGTRVPIQNLFLCLEGGESLDEFLDQFSTVTREQALAVLEESKEILLLSHEVLLDECVTRHPSNGVERTAN